jgi:hypothetical protein
MPHPTGTHHASGTKSGKGRIIRRIKQMYRFRITRRFFGIPIGISLTGEELEDAYRAKSRIYLREDMVNAVAEAHDYGDCRLCPNDLEKAPELLEWLCDRFDDFLDANMSHNDLLELTINHLANTASKPAFFHALATNAKGESRAGMFRHLAGLLSAHHLEDCPCRGNGDTDIPCPASMYLSGGWGMAEFIHSSPGWKDAGYTNSKGEQTHEPNQRDEPFV